MDVKNRMFKTGKGPKTKSYSLSEDMILAVKLLAESYGVKESDVVRDALDISLTNAVNEGRIPPPPYAKKNGSKKQLL